MPQPASSPAPEQPAHAPAPVSASRGETPRRDPVLDPARIYRVPWANLLKKVFAIDVLACPECGGRLKLIAFFAEGTVAGRILDHLGLDSQGPPVARAQAPPELFDPGPDYDVADPSFTN